MEGNAMKTVYVGCFCLCLFCYGFGQIADHLVISEIRYDERTGLNEEFIELYNPTSQPVELNGYHLAYKSKEGDSWRRKLVFDETHHVQPFGFFLFGGSDVEVDPDILSEKSLGLGNSGGHIALFQYDSVLVDLVAWEGGLTPEGGSDAGQTEDGGSLERKSCEEATALSMTTGGTHALAGNGWDSNQNGSDFVAHEADFCNPQNSASAVEEISLNKTDNMDSDLGLLHWPSVEQWSESQITLVYESSKPCQSVCYLNFSGEFADSVQAQSSGTLHQLQLSGIQPGEAAAFQLKLYTDTSYNKIVPGLIAWPQPESTGEIQIYFNGSVNTEYAGETPAQGEEDLAERLVHYLDEACFSIDFCFMKLTDPDIRDALIRAKTRGVTVRVICDDSYSNYGEIEALQAAGIPVIGDDYGPNDGSGIMHHKFAVIDFIDKTSATDDYIWTGSYNATYYKDSLPALENVVVIQDQSLAALYTASFNVMWGSDSETPDAVLSRFGENRPDTGPAFAKIRETLVELIISPSSSGISCFCSQLQQISQTCLFSIFSFTHDSVAAVLSDLAESVFVAGLWDEEQIADDGSVSKWPFFSDQSEELFRQDGYGGTLHHKYLIGDVMASSGTPFVITGSMNWSYSGENRNDENMLIIRNGDVANQYLQEFAARYEEAGGQMPSIFSGCPAQAVLPQKFMLQKNYPNPFNNRTLFRFFIPHSTELTIQIADVRGRCVVREHCEFPSSGWKTWAWNGLDQQGNEMPSGVYLFSITGGSHAAVQKMTLIK